MSGWCSSEKRKTGLCVALATSSVRHVNCVDAFKRTALHYACTLGHEMCVRWLLTHQANASLEDYQGNSALNNACSYNNASCALLLLVYGVNVNHVNGNGYTPLLQACLFGNNACARALLEYGADVQNRTTSPACSVYENVVLSMPRLDGEEMVEMLLEYGTVLIENRTPKGVIQRQQQPWSRQLQQQPIAFHPHATRVLMTILMCAARFVPFLPPELWENAIFPYFKRRDFNFIFNGVALFSKKK